MTETEDQRIDRERLKRHIEREQLVPVLNDTKWRRLMRALEPLEYTLDFRRKDVREDEPDLDRWCSELHYMFGGWENIEWLDIRAILRIHRGALVEPERQDNIELLMGAVRKTGVTFTRHDYGVRIYGHIRPGTSQEWKK